jgi:phage repressor protein C with HTH and peptisase S24 domain
MTDPQREMRMWLAEELQKMGHGARSRLAEFLGVRTDAITRMTNLDPRKESREIRAHEYERMKEFFHAAEAEAPQARHEVGMNVPLMGYLGAGAVVEPDYEQVPPDGLEQIWLPMELPEDMIAFRVRGLSMLPLYKPDAVIVVWREQRRPLQSFYGEEAAVLTEDGRRFIKTIMRGPNGVTLTSLNAEPIENVRVKWIGEIFATLNPNALRKLGKHAPVPEREPEQNTA